MDSKQREKTDAETAKKKQRSERKSARNKRYWLKFKGTPKGEELKERKRVNSKNKRAEAKEKKRSMAVSASKSIHDVNPATNTHICPQCSYTLSVLFYNRLIRENRKGEKPFPMMDKTVVVCMTCQSNARIISHARIADSNVLRSLQVGKDSLNMPTAVARAKKMSLRIDYKSVIKDNNGLLLRLGMCKGFDELSSLVFRHVVVKCCNKTSLGAIKGGKHPEGFQYDEGQLLQSRPDGSLIVITFNNSEDFVCLGRVSLENRDIVDLSKRETDIILNERPKAIRPGTTAGFYFIPANGNFSNEPRCYSGCTQRGERQVYFNPTGNTTATTVVYKEKGKKPNSFTGYPNVCMNRLDSAPKRKAAQLSGSYRRILIAEMSSRLSAMFCVVQLGKLPMSIFDSFIKAMDRAVGEEMSEESWQKVDGSLDLWETILLEYACSTGEMRNHQAVCAHEDGNKSHPLETMMMFGKLPVDEAAACESQNEALVSKMTPGITSILPASFGIVMRPGIDIAHISLKNTMHVADPSRDTNNWSKVHGP